MPEEKEALAKAIRAYKARQLAYEATDERLTAKVKVAEEYFANVVRPTLAKIQADAAEAGLPLAHLKGTLLRAEGGARIRETLAMHGSSPYGDTRASHVLVDWWGGNHVQVSGRVQNQVGSWPIKAGGLVAVGGAAEEVGWLVRECLVAILESGAPGPG